MVMTGLSVKLKRIFPPWAGTTEFIAGPWGEVDGKKVRGKKKVGYVFPEISASDMPPVHAIAGSPGSIAKVRPAI